MTYSKRQPKVVVPCKQCGAKIRRKRGGGSQVNGQMASAMGRSPA